MKKVLLTGANGFTGRHTHSALTAAGWEVIPLTHHSGQLINEIPLDFCHRRFPQELALLPAVDAVVHLGARVGWDGSERADLFRPNVMATGHLAAWARESGAYFLFASAALIAGPHLAYIDDAHAVPPDLNTCNDYLYSKWLGEQVIRMSGVRHGILRISGIFGMGGPSHLGINRAIDGALSGKPPRQQGEGRIKRNYIYVGDLARTIVHCLENQIEGTHLVAGTRTNTLSQMLKTICRHLLPGSEPEKTPEKAGQASGHDQVIEPSPYLPSTRTFARAVRDIVRIKNKK